MKTHLTRRALPAFTLVEMTIVISVSLSLISVVTTSARTWKRNSDRADCVADLRNFQMAVRSYQSANGYQCGMFHVNLGGRTDIADHLLENGRISRAQHRQSIGVQSCNAGGEYYRIQPDRFPLQGESYLTCTLAAGSLHHQPDHTADW
jgi:type II secretory pathway pseudopilin PulG